MLGVLVNFIHATGEALVETYDEESPVQHVEEDIASMAAWLEEHEDIDKEMGLQAKNFLRELKKADEAGIDFYATLEHTEREVEDE